MCLRAVLLATLALATACGRAPAPDAVSAGPEVYRILLDNDEVRVLEAEFQPGDKVGMHWHPEHVSYVLAGGTLRVGRPDGGTREQSAQAGKVSWGGELTHSVENVGTEVARLLIVEMK